MMDAQHFRLINQPIRTRAASAVLTAPDGYVCEVKPQARNAIQNAKLHAIFSDIARQREFFGKKRDVETVKRLLVDAFARVKAEMGEHVQQGSVLPSLDGQGIVQLGIQTRRFSKAQMAEFITYLHAWGADNGIRFSDGAYVPGWHRDRSAA